MCHRRSPWVPAIAWRGSRRGCVRNNPINNQAKKNKRSKQIRGMLFNLLLLLIWDGPAKPGHKASFWFAAAVTDPDRPYLCLPRIRFLFLSFIVSFFFLLFCFRMHFFFHASSCEDLFFLTIFYFILFLNHLAFVLFSFTLAHFSPNC